MRRFVVIAILAAAFVTFGLATAKSQTYACAPRALILEKLERFFDEHRSSVAVTSDGRLLEVLTSPTGTWSILITTPGGPACLVAAGDGWRKVTPRGNDKVS